MEGLVSTIYRTQDESAIDKHSVDTAFVQDRIKTEFGQVANTEALKKMVEIAKRSQEQSALLTEVEAEAENEGM